MHFKLDKFKKVSSDAKTTTLQHPDGHKITIAHAAISVPMRKKLDALPVYKDEGGDIEQGKKDFVKGATDSGMGYVHNAYNNIVEGLTAKDEEPAQKGSQGSKTYFDGTKMRSQSMSSGGTVKDPTEEHMVPGDHPQNDIEKEVVSKKKQEMKMADGGDVPNSESVEDSPEQIMADAAKVEPQQPEAPKPNTQDYFTNGTFDFNKFALANPDKVPLEAQTAALQAQNKTADLAKALQNAGAMHEKARIDAYNQEAQKAGMPTKPYPDSVQSLIAAQSPVAAAPNMAPQGSKMPPAPTSPADPFGTQATYDAALRGIGEQKAGMAQEAAATGQLGNQQAQVLGNAIEQQKTQQQQYQDHYNDLENERQAFQRDIQNNLIDPNHYLNSKDTGQKIATGIGLIISGMGAGAGKQPNMAMEFLNRQINNDIEAQKANLGARQNLLSANLRQFGNLRDATEMTRVMQTDIVANQLKQKAAAMQDPFAKARLLQEAGKLDLQTAGMVGQMAMRKSLLSGMNNGQVAPERVVYALVPENERAGAMKELQTAQNMASHRDNLLNAFDQLTPLNTVSNRITSPLQTPKRVKAIEEPLLAQLVKDSEGRITPQDVPMIQSMFPRPGDDAKTNMDRRSQLNKFITEKMHFPTLDLYGINVNNASRYNAQGAPRVSFGPPKQQ